MEVFALILSLAACNLAHRLVLLPILRMTFDSWGHLYFSMETKRSGAGPFRPIKPKVVGAEEFHYPLLLHWLYGLLPRRLLREKIQLINPAIESIFLGVFSGFIWKAGWPIEVVALSAILYILTPSWFSKVSIGPRVLNFTTRIFSEIAFPLGLAIALFELGLPPAAAVALATLTFAFILLGSKFGVQTVVLVTPLAGALAQSWTLVTAWLLAFPVALILSRGAIAEQLRQQAQHLKWYFQELRAGRTLINGRNSTRFLVLWDSKRSAAANARKLIFSWFARNSFTAVLLKAPHIPIALVLLVVASTRGMPFPRELAGPLLAAAAIYLVTSLRWFLFLGEAERYLSHISIFTNLLFVLLCMSLDLQALIWLVAAYGLAFSVGEAILLRKGLEGGDSRAEDEVIAYLRQLIEPRTVVIFPYHAVSPYRIMIETEHETVFPWLSGSRHKSEIREVEDYPYLDLHRLDRLVELTFADLLIVSSAERSGRLSGWTAPHSWIRVDLGVDEFEIYERVGSANPGQHREGPCRAAV